MTEPLVKTVLLKIHAEKGMQLGMGSVYILTLDWPLPMQGVLVGPYNAQSFADY